ncbi:hypothetical protein HMPREF1011_01005 [Anaerostipes caccae]|nr:hypothetical protein HMPREF1011_01005 [Anaerostipes caccae]
MLEDALPYLPPTLKKSAALYIKLHELQNIMEDFDDEDTLSACGLDQNNASLEMMLTAMRMRAPKETSKQIDQILQMMKMAKNVPVLSGFSAGKSKCQCFARQFFSRFRHDGKTNAAVYVPVSA